MTAQLKHKHKRNVDGLRVHVQRKHEACIQRTDEAIRLLLREGCNVNFTAVSKAARVSTAWLYKQEKIKVRIMNLREEITHVPIPHSQRASSDSKDKIIIALKERLKKSESEIKVLKEQLKVAYGQLAASGHA